METLAELPLTGDQVVCLRRNQAARRWPRAADVPIDHVGINTNDMEATLQFYCGILGMRLVRTTRTPDGRRHYNIEIGGGNAFAVFDGAALPTAGERQHVNHLALPVDTSEEFNAAYQRLKQHGVAVTEIIERGYGKTFYFHDPNGIRLQIELKTKQDAVPAAAILQSKIT